jgi:hypothetical protein
MPTPREHKILHRARRDGVVTVAWESADDKAALALVARGLLREDDSRNAYFTPTIMIAYVPTKEG